MAKTVDAMTYRDHHREALRRSRVPLYAAEFSLSKAAEQLPWIDEVYRGPDTDGRLVDSWGLVKRIVKQFEANVAAGMSHEKAISHGFDPPKSPTS
jgi:hypothetical protein